MDAINSLVGGMRQAQITFDAAAQQISAADLPSANSPDPTNPMSPQPATAVASDPVGQFVTMTIAADVQHFTSAALRSAFSMYRASVELGRSGHRD